MTVNLELIYMTVEKYYFSGVCNINKYENISGERCCICVYYGSIHNNSISQHVALGNVLYCYMAANPILWDRYAHLLFLYD